MSQPDVLAATVSIEVEGRAIEAEFEDVHIAANTDKTVVVVLRNAKGERVVITMPKAKVKDMVSWKMLI